MMHTYILLHNMMHDLFDTGVPDRVAHFEHIEGVPVALRWSNTSTQYFVKAQYDGHMFYTQNMRKESGPTFEVRASVEAGDPIRYTWITNPGQRGFVGKIETRGGITTYISLTSQPNIEIAREETPRRVSRRGPQKPPAVARAVPVVPNTTTPKERSNMSILDIVRQSQESRSAVIPENLQTGTNLIITASSLTEAQVRSGARHLVEFKGTVPVWDPAAPVDAGPSMVHENIPCALDMTTGRLVITEAHAFRQPRGGFAAAAEAEAKGEPVEKMNQIEGAAALVGVRLGFMDNGEFIAHPMYDDERFAVVANRALEIYWKTPFLVPEETVEELRVALYDNNDFVVAQLGERATPSRREDLWHLQAPSKGGNVRDQILARQQSGLVLDSMEILAARPLGDRPPSPTGAPRPEFENFMCSMESNLQRITVELAKGTAASDALRLSSAVTGVEDGGFPMRATVASMAWTQQTGPRTWAERSLRFFPAGVAIPADAAA